MWGVEPPRLMDTPASQPLHNPGHNLPAVEKHTKLLLPNPARPLQAASTIQGCLCMPGLAKESRLHAVACGGRAFQLVLAINRGKRQGKQEQRWGARGSGKERDL